MGLFDSIVGLVSGGNTTTPAATLTPEQQAYLNNWMSASSPYISSTLSGYQNLATNPQSTYQAIDPQYYQDVIANPYLRQREQQWSDIEGKVAGGGNFHSSALTKQKSIFDEATATNLLSEKSDLFNKERMLEMNADEQALARQLQAYGGLGTLLGVPLGTQATENIVTQDQSLLQKLLPAAALFV